MSYDVPPNSIAWEVDRWIPGIWPAFVEAVNRAWYVSPFTVTSWWRSPDRNLAVEGDPDSQHLCALALDVVPGTPAVEAALRARGFRTVRYPTHIHAQVLQAGLARRSGLLNAIGV